MTLSCRFELCAGDEQDRLGVRFHSPGAEPIKGPFLLDLSADKFLDLLERIEGGMGVLDDLRYVGATLWNSLTPPRIKERFKALAVQAELARKTLSISISAHLDEKLAVIPASDGVKLPATLEGLPWEALFDEALDTFLAVRPRYSVVRAPPPDWNQQPITPTHEAGPPRVLALIPEGSGLPLHLEWQHLKQLADQVGPARLELKLRHGKVTINDVTDAVRTGGPFDVIHFLGHGKLMKNGPHLRFNQPDSDQPDWISASEFAIRIEPANARLALLNCCFSGAARLGFADMGTRIMQVAKVPAVIAMRHEIPNDAAIDFASDFYRTLITGRPEELGRIDLAAREARLALHGGARRQGRAHSIAIPVLSHAPGAELMPRRPAPAAPAIAPARRAPQSDDPLFKELVESLRSRQCVVVLGPGVHFPDGPRRGGEPRTAAIDGLVKELAAQCNFPDLGALRSTDTEGPLFTSVLLARVCQYLQHTHARKRPALLKLIEAWHQELEPTPALLRVARWPVPGIVYTPFDGLMARALKQERTHFVPIHSIARDGSKSAGTLSARAADSTDPYLLLVNARGTIDEHKSLILTEADHEELWLALAHPRTEVQGLVAATGRSLLFLGLSPKDAVARRLVALTERGDDRVEGPVFFVTREATEVDAAFWKPFNTHFIDKSSSEAIEELHAALGGSP